MLKVWTDGSCLGNPGNGGWAFVMTDGAKTAAGSGGERNTTNNRMELAAVINALSAIKRHRELELVTDSNYVKLGVQLWLEKWKRNGWRGSRRQPVANQDLWMRLDELLPRFDIRWSWVRGHTGDRMNERCDALAYAAAQSLSSRGLTAGPRS